MSKILISYRREDSAHVTGRIYDRLTQQFGRTAVFKDVDSIPLGIDFRTYLDQQVAKCDVFLAVIGRHWMKPQGQKSKCRLADPADFVRLEIEAALKRQIPVIPVLVEGAVIPVADRLPTSLQGLSYRNGIVVRPDPDFHRDMDRLIDHLRAQIERERERLPPSDAEHSARDVQATTKVTRSEIEPPGQETVEAVVPVAEVESQGQAVEPVEEAPATPTPTARTTTDQSQSSMFGVIGLLVLIGAAAAFLLLQPKSSPVYSPPVVEKKEEQPVQALPPQMVRISPGSFMMGGKDDGPLHKVQFTKPFAVARYETTFDEYDRFAQATGRQLPKDRGWGRGQRPVIYVNWNDAKAYAQWLSQQTGQHYRLPTEAEWEYAARAGTATRYWWGDEIGKNQANCDGCRSEWDNKQTAPVGSFQPNKFDLYDTAGNVWEWVEDCWNENYEGAPGDGSAWLEAKRGDCGRRVIRGGSWNYVPGYLRVSLRFGYNAVSRDSDLGFRLAQDLP